MSNVDISVTYQLTTGTEIEAMDKVIESTLHAKARSSGCGFGEWGGRDMQFSLDDTPQTRKRIELLKQQQGVEVTVC